MRNLFEHTSAPWLRYSSYEYMENENGELYIVVSKGAKAEMYSPMRNAEIIVMDAVKAGRLAATDKGSDEAKRQVLEFVNKYGFLGLMTAIPTTADFIEYESVYFPKNHFITEESLSTEDYLKHFFPFEKLDFQKKKKNSVWNVKEKEGIAAAMAIGDAPRAVAMSFQRQYAEKYNWIAEEFVDWYFTFMTTFIYYKDKDVLDDETKELMQKGMKSFGAIAPTYRLELGEKHPIIIWDFYSLAVMIQMSASFLLTDPDTKLGVCKHCGDLYIAERKGTEFCSAKCKNQYNVYKSRKKSKGE